MILSVNVTTSSPDLFIDFIEVRLKSGQTVSLNWDESEIERTETGFSARYKGVCFGEEYANGRIRELRNLKVDEVGLYSESGEVSDFTIEEMVFEDGGNPPLIIYNAYKLREQHQKAFLLPDYRLFTSSYHPFGSRYYAGKIEDSNVYGVYDSVLRDWYRSGGRVVFENKDLAEAFLKTLPITTSRANTETGPEEFLLTGRRCAKHWFQSGVPIFRIHKNEDGLSADPANSYQELVEHIGDYGIRPKDWISFSESDEVRSYYYARKIFCDAALTLLQTDLHYVTCLYADAKSDHTFLESKGIEGYFEGKAKPTVEQMNPYLSELFHDFTEYLYLGGFLEPYGWSREDVEEAILEKLPDDVREICAEELGPKEEETDIGGMTM